MAVLIILAVLSGIGFVLYKFLTLGKKVTNENQYLCVYTTAFVNARCIAEIGDTSIEISNFILPIIQDRVSVKYSLIRSCHQDYSLIGRKIVLETPDGKIGLVTDKADEMEQKIQRRMTAGSSSK